MGVNPPVSQLNDTLEFKVNKERGVATIIAVIWLAMAGREERRESECYAACENSFNLHAIISHLF
jgi:hypothetical protein